MISNFLQILGLQPRISIFLSITRSIVSFRRSEQLCKQNIISTMWFFIGVVCLFVMRFVKRAIYMQVTSAPSLPKHLIIMRPLKIQIVVFSPVVDSLRPKFGFGIGNRNQGTISVSEPIFFSETETFIFQFFLVTRFN